MILLRRRVVGREREREREEKKACGTAGFCETIERKRERERETETVESRESLERERERDTPLLSWKRERDREPRERKSRASSSGSGSASVALCSGRAEGRERKDGEELTLSENPARDLAGARSLARSLARFPCFWTTERQRQRQRQRQVPTPDAAKFRQPPTPPQQGRSLRGREEGKGRTTSPIHRVEFRSRV